MTSLREQLDAMARHVRDPVAHAGPPGIEPRRLAIYRDLVHNNLDGLLAGNFPVLRKTLSDTDWHALVRGFLANHQSHTPLFTELGRELIDYLQGEAGADASRPWIAELAHYEWAELGLQLLDVTLPAHAPNGDLMTGVPVLSPLAWPLAYRWPVAQIGPAFQPDAPPLEPTLVLLQRDHDGKVRFSALSPLLFALLERIGANRTASARELLMQLAREAGQDDIEAFIAAAHPMLQQLRQQGVLLGIRIDALQPGDTPPSASLS
ncbi:MAG: putative DNA-binding domain-containing protein [Pseudomonadota bacterium]|nr:putative DNA-binding domain-containing protein [Pseudomonadota bacterium]